MLERRLCRQLQAARHVFGAHHHSHKRCCWISALNVQKTVLGQ